MGPLLVPSPVPRNIPLGLSDSPERDESVSYCHDNVAKQASPKFTGYKSKRLFFLLMCPSAGPRFGPRFQASMGSNLFPFPPYPPGNISYQGRALLITNGKT